MKDNITKVIISESDINDDPIFYNTKKEVSGLCKSEDLNRLDQITAKLRQRKKENITFKKPLISLGEEGIIYPNTINLIQGPAGAHKSRLAEILCALTLSFLRVNKILLNFVFSYTKALHLCYIDTERNTNDQFPLALQKIQLLAGYKKEEDPPNFVFSSFIEFKRLNRQKLLESYVQNIREDVSGHLFIVLDVVTDFVGDFNRTNESLELIDWMNTLVNQYDVTFLVIIHENPGSEKARGHVGTELLNKVSTAIQIRPETGMEDLDVYKVKFLKCRNSKRPPDFFVRYADDLKSLVTIDDQEMELLRGEISVKAPVNDIACELFKILDGQIMSKKMLLASLRIKFQASDKTLMERIDLVINSKIPIMGNDNKTWFLQKSSKGREVQFELQPQ